MEDPTHRQELGRDQLEEGGQRSDVGLRLKGKTSLKAFSSIYIQIKLVLATACVVEVDQAIYKQSLPHYCHSFKSSQPPESGSNVTCVFLVPKTSAADLTVLQRK